MDEGYIKYNSDWENREIEIDEALFVDINYWRKRFYSKGWIGVYPDGIGFGNISLRLNGNQFLISGSATGAHKEMEKAHYSIVRDFDLQLNSLNCYGSVAASSESLSHAALYKADKSISRIVHIHNMELWKKWKNKLPTTSKSIAYGTPEMAFGLQDCLKTISGSKGIIIMGGHAEGIIAFGNDFEEIAKLLDEL